GKSPLAKLLLRHHKPDGGRILLDGVDIAQVSPTSLRRAVGSILQKPFLFNATIRENITLDHKVVDTTALERCAKLAAAHDFIEKMPLGYNSMAGEGGASLSGGQRQRISIA
ncbi:MAG TPA: type I secretion system permease/ATPase, partial [Planctomycetes bacterium]|nr:type I secretion system permease/ATPase [Planctomycetota bacterium]